jgi:glycerophosphoryl diester phosphodiesterase
MSNIPCHIQPRRRFINNQRAIMVAVAAALMIAPGHVDVLWADDPIPVAHRGLLRHAPENTLPAFAACLELGMGFELDIRTTSDGHMVILHDDSVGRTTDHPDRSVRDMTLQQVRQLDAGSWFDPIFAEVRIPTLEETLALIRDRKRGPTIIALNIKHVTPAEEAKLVSLVEKHDLLNESFAFDQNAELSRRLKKLNPNFRIGQNVNRQSLDARLTQDFLDVFLLTFAPTGEEVNQLHKRRKQVLFNYAGESRRNADTWKRVQAAGIDGMLTDYPLDCRTVWRTKQP